MIHNVQLLTYVCNILGDPHIVCLGNARTTDTIIQQTTIMSVDRWINLYPWLWQSSPVNTSAASPLILFFATSDKRSCMVINLSSCDISLNLWHIASFCLCDILSKWHLAVSELFPKNSNTGTLFWCPFLRAAAALWLAMQQPNIALCLWLTEVYQIKGLLKLNPLQFISLKSDQ